MPWLPWTRSKTKGNIAGQGARQRLILKTASSGWREEGNGHYASAAKDGLAPTVKMGRLQKAIDCYEKAHSCARDDGEVASAAKNLAVSSWKLADVMGQMNEPWPNVKFRFRQALKYFNNACTKGTGKTQEWFDGIVASSRGCWESMGVLKISGKDKKEHITTIQEFVVLLPVPDIKADCYLEIAEYHFHTGVSAISSGDYKVCLAQMKDCHFPLHEAMRLGSHLEHIRTEVSVLEEDVANHTRLAESMKSEATGDQLLNIILMKEEELNITMVWEVIDWYRDGVIHVRDLDVKREAICLSKIGVVYERVLKLRFRAKEYLKKAIELAMSIYPFDVSKEEWYKQCTTLYEGFQKETLLHEQQEQDKRRQAVREELKPDIDKLQKHEQDGDISFLRFVYSTWKPINPDYKLDLKTNESESERDVRKRCLQRAIIHYHPDRVKEADKGLKAKVLSEEITKFLTRRYERLK